MPGIPAAHVSGVWVVAQDSGAGAVAQQACAPPGGDVPGDVDLAVMHVPTAAETARDGDDSERASMRTVNCLDSLIMNGGSGESTATDT